MRGRLLVTAAVLALATNVVSAQNAAPPSMSDQISAQYKFVKMGSDTSGASVVEEGTVLAIQKGGILGVPYTDASPVQTKYQDGAMHAPSGLSMIGRKSVLGRFGKEQTTRLFKTGEKVYPSKLDVNLNKDTVTMTIIACDTCNKTDPPTYYKAQVVFEFPKGYLATASVPKVEDTIAQVFTISDAGSGDSQQGGNNQGGQDQGNQSGQDQGGGQQAQGGQQQQQAAPASIEKGQTIDQVIASWGQPQKVVNLGAKQIYIYQDAKITFLNGKVSDVQ